MFIIENNEQLRLLKRLSFLLLFLNTEARLLKDIFKKITQFRYTIFMYLVVSQVIPLKDLFVSLHLQTVLTSLKSLSILEFHWSGFEILHVSSSHLILL